VKDSSTAAHLILLRMAGVSRGRSSTDLEKSSYGVGSDAVITQDILENKSKKPVRTTSENIESELVDHITRTYSPPAYLAD
jgi:hypothetical protein